MRAKDECRKACAVPQWRSFRDQRHDCYHGSRELGETYWHTRITEDSAKICLNQSGFRIVRGPHSRDDYVLGSI